MPIPILATNALVRTRRFSIFSSLSTEAGT
jgi:hypothetical protein